MKNKLFILILIRFLPYLILILTYFATDFLFGRIGPCDVSLLLLTIFPVLILSLLITFISDLIFVKKITKSPKSTLVNLKILNLIIWAILLLSSLIDGRLLLTLVYCVFFGYLIFSLKKIEKLTFENNKY